MERWVSKMSFVEQNSIKRHLFNLLAVHTIKQDHLILVVLYWVYPIHGVNEVVFQDLVRPTNLKGDRMM